MVRVILAVAALLAAAAPLRADELADMRQRGQLVCGVTDILDLLSFPGPATGRMSGYEGSVELDFPHSASRGKGYL